MGSVRMGSVRLGRELEAKVRRVAALKGLTFAEVYRLALTEYCEREMPEPKTSRYDDPFYESIFGAFGGPPDLAARSEEIFGEIMDEKHRRRHDRS